MVFSGKKSGNWFYILITILVIILIIIVVLFSGNQLIKARIEDNILEVNGWIESGERDFYNERFFGLEKQDAFRYVVDESHEDGYPAFLVLTTIKTFFITDEEELLEKTIETIYSAGTIRNIVIDNNSKIIGSRTLLNNHNTYYILFNGTITSNNLKENVKIIGENWNCPKSSSSIICIGVAQTTKNFSGILIENLAHWIELTADEKGTLNGIYNTNDFQNSNGLIYNIKCH